MGKVKHCILCRIPICAFHNHRCRFCRTPYCDDCCPDGECIDCGEGYRGQAICKGCLVKCTRCRTCLCKQHRRLCASCTEYFCDRCIADQDDEDAPKECLCFSCCPACDCGEKLFTAWADSRNERRCECGVLLCEEHSIACSVCSDWTCSSCIDDDGRCQGCSNKESKT